MLDSCSFIVSFPHENSATHKCQKKVIFCLFISSKLQNTDPFLLRLIIEVILLPFIFRRGWGGWEGVTIFCVRFWVRIFYTEFTVECESSINQYSLWKIRLTVTLKYLFRIYFVQMKTTERVPHVQRFRSTHIWWYIFLSQWFLIRASLKREDQSEFIDLRDCLFFNKHVNMHWTCSLNSTFSSFL